VDAYATAYGITYYNFLELATETGIDYATDTYDGGLHFNLSGAEKLSDYLGEKLSQVHRVTIRNADSAYVEIWNTRLERYRQELELKQAEVNRDVKQ